MTCRDLQGVQEHLLNDSTGALHVALSPRPVAGFTRAPEIATDSLLLAPHRPEDWEESADMWADPELVRYIGGRSSWREESWGRLLKYAGMWSLLGYGYWCVRERLGGRFVGELGFANFKRDIEPKLGDLPEAGWALSPWAHGRGFAREALMAILAWADSNIGARTVCMIDDESVPSIRLAQSCGFEPCGPATSGELPTRIHARVNRRP